MFVKLVYDSPSAVDAADANLRLGHGAPLGSSLQNLREITMKLFFECDLWRDERREEMRKKRVVNNVKRGLNCIKCKDGLGSISVKILNKHWDTVFLSHIESCRVLYEHLCIFIKFKIILIIFTLAMQAVYRSWRAKSV